MPWTAAVEAPDVGVHGVLCRDRCPPWGQARPRWVTSAVPVQVPDYLSYITTPMDFWTMEQKVRRHEYASLDQFEADFRLVVDNCTTYNSRDTLYYRAAVKMREQVSLLGPEAPGVCMRAIRGVGPRIRY